MFLVTADMHNKLLVGISKRAQETLPVHEKSLKNKNDLCLVFGILNEVSTKHNACLCKISSCSGDRKLGFLKLKKFKAVFVNPTFGARRSVAARRCSCYTVAYWDAFSPQ